MFFILSKLSAWFLEPLSWVLCLSALALVLIWRQRYRGARAALIAAMALQLMVTSSPLGDVLIRPLEQAFPAPALTVRVHGIIVLTGAEDATLTHAYGKVQLNGDAERYTEFVALARAHPEAALIVSGGSGTISGEAISGAEVVRRFLVEQGLDGRRLVLEEKSRTTAESAVNTRELLRPEQGQSWVLVTSASHMLRAAGTFRKAGFTIVPYPVSYLAEPAFNWRFGGLQTTSVAVREWVGIAVYRWTGRM